MTEPKKKTPVLGGPLDLGNVDFTPLYEACKEYVDFLNSERCHGSHENHNHFIFESAISCIYGKDFWEWYNSKFV